MLLVAKLVVVASMELEKKADNTTRHSAADTAGPSPSDSPEDLALLLRSLKSARACNDKPAMIRLASRLRINYPAIVDGYQIGALALRQSGRLDEAAFVLGEAVTRTKETLWLALERAELARQRGDWPDVGKQAHILRDRFPGETVGWRLGFAACRQFGDLEGGDILLQQLPPRARLEEWALEGSVLVAASRGDWWVACACAEALRTSFSRNEHGYRLGLRSLRHLRCYDTMAKLAARASELFPSRTWLVIENAFLAQACSDWSEARRLWQQVRDVSSNLAEGYIGGVRASLALRLFGEADTILATAAARFPDAAWLLAQQAEIASRQGESHEATQLWARLRRLQPDAKEGYHGAYRQFRKLGRFEDAEAVLEEALARFPRDRWALAERALLAKAKLDFPVAEQHWLSAVTALPDDREIALRYALARSQDVPVDHRDWATTRSRLQALNARFPGYILGWLEHIRTLRFMGASPEAADLARASLQDFPGEAELWLEYARATTDDTGQVTAERLTEAASRLPEDRMVQTALAEALGRAGRIDEAESAYQQALQRFEHSADLLCGYAVISMRRRDWAEALARWTTAQAEYPSDSRVAAGLLDTRAALEETQAGTTQPGERNPLDAAMLLDRGEILAEFESLGGTGQGCEFGLIQRIAGVESLGLLRWMHITPAGLTRGLLDRFEGVGTPEQTILDFFRSEDPENPEYRYRDVRLETRMHTFVHKKDMPQADMFKQTCRRVGFLARKLIQDLDESRKIFVYKIYERTLDTAELAGLHGAMRNYGENTLLYVCYADASHPSGSVEQAGPGLLIGYISGFNVCRETHQVRAPDLPAWNAICRAAYALHGGRAG